MNRTAGTDVATIERIGHAEAMCLTTAENQAFAACLASLAHDDWTRPTDCDRWDVRQVVAHVVGAAAAQASIREFARQVRAGRPVVAEIGSEHWWDGMNEIQVRERRDAGPTDLMAEWDRVADRAHRARARLPRPLARLPLLDLPAPVGRQPLAYLFDMGFTRDVWMHRIDIGHATGKVPSMTAHHDGRILADIVAEWAATHGEPFTLVLHGPAGGTFRAGRGGATVETDVVDFCRHLTGRASTPGLLSHPLPL